MIKRNPDAILAWKQRSARKRISHRGSGRALQEVGYSIAHKAFLAAHPNCPVTGEETTQVHHSAKREGRWLNLQRYWIAVSRAGHDYIENHKTWAESVGLMVRIRETASEHIAMLESREISLFDPVFYLNWNGEIFLDLRINLIL